MDKEAASQVLGVPLDASPQAITDAVSALSRELASYSQTPEGCEQRQWVEWQWTRIATARDVLLQPTFQQDSAEPAPSSAIRSERRQVSVRPPYTANSQPQSPAVVQRQPPWGWFVASVMFGLLIITVIVAAAVIAPQAIDENNGEEIAASTDVEEDEEPVSDTPVVDETTPPDDADELTTVIWTAFEISAEYVSDQPDYQDFCYTDAGCWVWSIIPPQDCRTLRVEVEFYRSEDSTNVTARQSIQMGSVIAGFEELVVVNAAPNGEEWAAVGEATCVLL